MQMAEFKCCFIANKWIYSINAQCGFIEYINFHFHAHVTMTTPLATKLMNVSWNGDEATRKLEGVVGAVAKIALHPVLSILLCHQRCLRNHQHLEEGRLINDIRPWQLAELYRSEFDPELFFHSKYDKFLLTSATKVPYLAFCDKMRQFLT